MPLVFRLSEGKAEVGRDIYCNNLSQIFNFSTPDNITLYQPYDILAYNMDGVDNLIIFLQSKHDGCKIGQLVNGAYDLSEFNSTVMERIAQSTTPQRKHSF